MSDALPIFNCLIHHKNLTNMTNEEFIKAVSIEGEE